MLKKTLATLLVTTMVFTPWLNAHAESAFLLQLGSFDSREVALNNWQALQKKYPEALALLDVNINGVDVGDGKTIHRLQAGPLNSNKAAVDACGMLRAKQQNCFVVETAVMSNATPRQALRAVRASESAISADDELALNDIVGGANGGELIRLDTALPRAAAAMAPAPAPAEPAAEVAELASAIAADTSVVPDNAMPENAAPEKIVEAIAAQAPRMSADQAASAMANAAVQSAPAQVAAAPVPEVSAPLAFNQAPPAAAPTVAMEAPRVAMGSLGTLKLDAQGNVIGASNAATTMAATSAAIPTNSVPTNTALSNASPLVIPGALSPEVASAAQAIVNQRASTSMANASVDAATAQAIAQANAGPVPVDTQAMNTLPASAPELTPPSLTADDLRPSQSPDAMVTVYEAIPVAKAPPPAMMGSLNTPKPQPTPSALAAAPTPENRSIVEPVALTPLPASGSARTPEPWRGSPTTPAPAGTVWASVGMFENDAAALAFIETVRAQQPALVSGVRTKTSSNMALGNTTAATTLRVGPYAAAEQALAFCAQAISAGLHCDTAKDSPLLNTSGWGSSALNAPLRNNSLLAPNGLRHLSAPAAPIMSNLAEKNGVWAQLGSYNSPTEATSALSNMRGSAPDLFRGLRSSISQAPISAGDVASHRLRVGPFTTRTAALNFCSGVAQHGTGCLVIAQ